MDAEPWIREHLPAAGAPELVHDKAWSRVWKVPLPGGEAAWFKACAPVQAFEPALTAKLYARWPDRVVEVIAHDVERAWLLLGDAGTPLGAFGNAPEAWAVALPQYAELQRGETAFAADHLAAGVTDRRLECLPGLYDDMVGRELPLEPDEIAALRRFAPRFAALCAELAARGIAETLQHDDLHLANVYAQGDRMLILDWGDSTVAHPFFSLFVTFRFLDEVNRLAPDDLWFARLRDAYLEPWGAGLVDAFELAQRVGAFAHVFGWLRLRDHLPPSDRESMTSLPAILRQAIATAA